MAQRPISVRVPVTVQDPKEGLVTGWGVLSTDGKQLIKDDDGDMIPVSVLEAAVHDLVRAGGAGRAGDMHERRVGDIVEAMVVTAAKRKALGFGEGPEGWVATLKIFDQSARDLAGTAERPELSFLGALQKDENGVAIKMVIDELSIVDRGASGDDTHRPMIVLAKRAGDVQTPTGDQMDLEQVLAAMDEEARAVVLAALEEAAAPAPADDAEKAEGDPPKEEEAEKAEDEPKEDEPVAKAEGDDEEDKESVAKRAKFEASEKRAKVAEQKLADLEKSNRFEAVSKRVKEELSFIPGEVDSVAKMLVAAEDTLDKASLTTLNAAFESMNTVSKGAKIFTNIGSPVNTGADVKAEFVAAQKRHTDAGKTPALAHRLALHEDNLYERLIEAGEEIK